MLHKSFKPAKCKTSLKLAMSRIKLMRNKKGVQINQMKRELAQLLETGQDRTARIRVEHVIREEKMVAAYDLVEIYCELIVARMPIIESQKACPIDLKEAVTSVIFAAPRCSDISELADIKKQFTAKYGKEFVSAALELRPESGVSRMLVEKLSAVAPDVQTKVKVLTGVAKEHNINWEPTSFEEKESKPPNDLLNGPVHFENANPPKIQPSNMDHVHNPEKRRESRDPPLDFAEQNRKFVVDNGVGTSSSGINSEKMETRGEGQNWNMGFKDATSAAEAAAESAERAAMAARAAAQFASHEKVPDRDENHRVSASSGSNNEDRSKDSYESFRKSKITNQQKDRSEHEQKDGERFHEANSRSRKSDSFKESRTELKRGKKEDRKPKIMDRNEHGQKSNERFHEVTESKIELKSGKKEDFESENINFFAEESIKKQPSVHSSTSEDEAVSDNREVGKRIVVGNPFAVVDQRNLFSKKSKSDLDDGRNEEAVFDDDDGPKFDAGFEYDEEVDAHIWSPRRSESIKIEQMSSRSNIFSENLSFGKQSVKSMERSETDDPVPASFDNSDSESESEVSGNKKPDDILSLNPEPRKTRIELNDLVEGESSFYEPEVEDKRPHQLEQESYDKSEDNENSLKFGTLTGGFRNKGGLVYPPYTKPTEIKERYFKVSRMEDKKESSSESDSEAQNESESIKTKSKIMSPVTFFGDDDDNDDDDDGKGYEKKEVFKESPSSVRLRSELSRRTRGSPSVSSSSSSSRTRSRVDPEPKTVDSSVRKPSWKSEPDESPAQPRSYARKTEEKGRIEVEEKPKMPARVGGPRNGDKLGEENLGSEKVGVKKPSYVHPKLPDYDTFAARLQSLRDEHK